MSTFQPMPDLTPDEYENLRADIAANGVLVPVVVDQHGRILDGHNRSRIAAELGIECPRAVHEVGGDDEALDIAVTLNCARRHLTQEQKRDLIRSELLRRPEDSDRAIARRVGCSPTTVGTARAQWRAEAEDRVRRTHEAINKATTALRRGCIELLLAGASPQVVLDRLAGLRDDAAEGARDLDEIRQEHGVPATDGEHSRVLAVARQITLHAMYAATFNDITDVVGEVEQAGFEFPLPLTIPPRQLDKLIESIGEVSNLDTRAPVGGGVR